MARFGKMAIAPEAPTVEPTPVSPGAQVAVDYTALVVAHDSVRRAPAPPAGQQEQFDRLRRTTVKDGDPVVRRAAVQAAARLWCMKTTKAGEPDIKAVGLIARFLVWAAFGGIVDEGRALTNAVVEEYLTQRGSSSAHSEGQKRHVLYAVGRLMNPHEFPPANKVSAPRKRVPAASRFEILQMQAVIPGLPTLLGQRAQALMDLALGAGARPGDFKTLRGTAITSMAIEGQAVAVVTLPNHNGGVRQVPVVDPKISARLLGLSARVAGGLVLAPNAVQAERNIVNRISSELREHGHPKIDPAALRNRWIVDLANTVPAALLLQLADVSDLRVLVDQRSLLSTFKIRHAITILKETLT